jgi:hypothetical protein
MKYFYLFVFYIFMSGCEYRDLQNLETKINVTSTHEFYYDIIGFDEKPALALKGNIVSLISLKEILLKNQFDYARIECENFDKFRPYAYLSIKEEQKEKSNFKSDFLMKICPEDDANSKYCIQNLEDFKGKVDTDLNCNVIFGGMTKQKVIISNSFKISKERILNAKKYLSE